MIRSILLKVSVSVVGVSAVLFLTKAWNQDSASKSFAAKRPSMKSTSEVR